MDFKSLIDGLVNNPKLSFKQKSDQLKHYFDNLDNNDPELDHKKHYIDEAAKDLKNQLDLSLRIVNRQNLYLSENSGSNSVILNSSSQSTPSIPTTSLFNSNNVFNIPNQNNQRDQIISQNPVTSFLPTQTSIPTTSILTSTPPKMDYIPPEFINSFKFLAALLIYCFFSSN
jgi:hypothetical protein